MKRKYKYGAFGSGRLFWNRVFCRHRFEDQDTMGLLQRCRKCGLYRSGQNPRQERGKGDW